MLGSRSDPVVKIANGWFFQWLRAHLRGPLSLALLGTIVVIAGGFYLRAATKSFGLPYPYYWDEPEILHPAIRVLRNGQYRAENFAYGPMNVYIHAAWGAITYLRGIGWAGINTIWDLRSNKDTGWYWSVTWPYFYEQARLLSAILWLGTAISLAGAAWKYIGKWAAFWTACALTFNYTTLNLFSRVSVDAQAISAAAVAIWASAHILETRARWAYVTAIISSALAASCKYILWPAILLPFLAHLLSTRSAERRFFDVRLTLMCVGVGAALSVFLLPALLDPPRFLHALANEATFYAGGEVWELGFWTQLKKSLINVAELIGIIHSTTPHWMRVIGILYLAILGVGVYALSLNNRRLLGLLLIPAALNVWQISGYPGKFFPRNLLFTLLCLALVGGAGWQAALTALSSWSKTGILKKVRVFLPCLVLLGVYLSEGLRVYSVTRDRVMFMDPRVELSQVLLGQLPKGTSVCITPETRWVINPTEKEHLQISEQSIFRLMSDPIAKEEAEYLIVPSAIEFYESDSYRAEFARIANTWLGTLEDVVAFGTASVPFGKHPEKPRVRLVKNEGKGRPDLLPRDIVWGPEFIHRRNARAVFLSKYGAALRHGATADSPVRLSKRAQKVIVKARGTSPFAQLEPPQLELSLHATTDTLRRQPLFKAQFALTRSQAGMVEYDAPCKVDPGNYQLVVKATDFDRSYLIDIEWVKFQ
ncbi:MAG: hypothetical protein D6691_07905 [Candidatus Hydrogenedentota bacterium]|jgi:hypothetical protein|uniref:Glycosyltransferase RgtA/B/C/D-like domain-containing protein n=1 Tax=Sumerlaea chitinivorans TaxID=2250252 RepID=A0A2Z4Y1S7_SUMC1|nr:hypothetical protein BRCON_0099 [Candidatus Sumerlaea chitinivorans]RMH26373.1 MAG: hypothetical protein D6691_07905 [Candidatus Hydrogenedentota bacterium]GIX44825.1 MAG: hypothetical protein KatS3mg130_1233 [Candidatus Sumerlaea sp.]